MRQLLLVLCLSFGVLLLHVSTAFACKWDREASRTEREFKTNYEFKSGYKEPEPVYEPPSERRWGPIAAVWSGASLLLIATGLVTLNVRRCERM
jgi:hypothetical protein